jgi:epoxyqueuosine reductase
MPDSQFASAVDELVAEGISWLSFVPKDLGPDPALCAAHGEDAGLLLMLAFGPRFGQATPYASAGPDAHPFDTRARALALAFAHKARLPGAELVYPGTKRLDLRAWLVAGRAQHVSRLGVGIRPDVGPWLAVRAAFVTALSERQRALLSHRFPALSADSSPCLRCEGAPCVSACPAQAVSKVGAFRVMDCVHERLREGSACALRCQARLACPVGASYRYPESQLRYHYGVSFRSLQKYMAEQTRA